MPCPLDVHERCGSVGERQQNRRRSRASLAALDEEDEEVRVEEEHGLDFRVQRL